MIAVNPKFDSKKDLMHDLYFDDDVNNNNNTRCDDHDDDDFYNLPLCVPQDSLDSMPWYPDNGEDIMINLNLDDDDIGLWTPMTQTNTNVVVDAGLVSSIYTDDNADTYKGTNTNNDSNNNQKHTSVAVILEKEDTTKLVSSVTTHKRRCYRNAKSESTGKEKRCSHCDTKTTPLWRKGPLGPNTLCNACGMRFRSGRLLNEYRPVASPTFDVNKHSNFHRRIFKRMSKTSDIKSKRLSSSQCEEHSLSTPSFKKQGVQKTYSGSKKRKRIQHDVDDMYEDFSI